MKFADRLKFTATGTSAATITVGAAVLGCRTLAQVISDGANDPLAIKVGDTGIPFTVDDGAGNEELALFTITSTTQITRTSVLSSSAGGTNPASFTGATLTVFNDVPASYLNGQSLTSFLAANPGSTVSSSDAVLMVQGSAVVGGTAGALATFANAQWPTIARVTRTITTTAAITLDVSNQQRKTYFCTATPSSISGPANYGSVGDGFECEFVNVSGNPIPLANMTVLPSGTSIPNNSSCRFKSGGGVLYADLGAAAAAAGGSVPAQVTGLTAGTATSTTQPLSWAAVTGATDYKVEYVTHGGTSWTTASANVSGTSYTVASLTASQSYDYRVSAIGAGGAGTPSAVVTASTAAASATEALSIGTISSPQTVNTAYTVSGTWTGVQPTALDYATTDNSGTQGAWNNAITSLVINANGTWSFSVTPTTASTSRTMQVRDHNAPTILSGQSTPYAVNAASGGSTAPFTVKDWGEDLHSGSGFPVSMPDNATSNCYHDITATGSATVVSVDCAISTSNTVAPTSAITYPTGKYFNMARAGSSWVVYSFPGAIGQVPAGTTVNYYFWLFVTDSNGAVWKFCHTNPIQLAADNVGSVVRVATGETIPQVQ